VKIRVHENRNLIFLHNKFSPKNREVRVRQGFSLTQSKYQMLAHLKDRDCHLSMYQFGRFFLELFVHLRSLLKVLMYLEKLWHYILTSKKEKSWAKKNQIVVYNSQNLPKRYSIRWPTLYLNSNTK